MNHIKEIAELLECGFICFYHVKNKTIEYYPDPDDFLSDFEAWQEVVDKVESEYNQYKKITKMDSNESFRVMENFIDKVDSEYFRNKLENILNKPKPFRTFKNLVEQSEYRQAWFDFRLNANMDLVKEQLEEK